MRAGPEGLVGDMQQDGAKRKVKGVLEGAGGKLRDFAGDGSRERAGSAPPPPGKGLRWRLSRWRELVLLTSLEMATAQR